MTKLVNLYTRPDDPGEFDWRYRHEYLPLVRTLPGMTRLETARITGAPLGAAPYYLIEEIYFADDMALRAAYGSSQWRTAQAAMEFARGLATTMFAEELSDHA
jgi:uncharacterized protein (TIGR02118 family)